MCPRNHPERRGIFRTVKPLVLASQSPRRRELLASLGLSFEVVPARIEEPAPSGERPEAYVLALARAKAREVAARVGKEKVVLAADTVVYCAGEILGKPEGPEEARRMLRLLSGRAHQVFTAYVIWAGEEAGRVVETRVYFKELSPAEIEAYLATAEPWDKAGAYAIQGMASYMVKRVEGSVTNVIGLPLSEVVEDLLKLEVIVPESAL